MTMATRATAAVGPSPRPAPLIALGSIKAPTTVLEGIAQAPHALMEILRPNATIGKVLVRLG